MNCKNNSSCYLYTQFPYIYVTFKVILKIVSLAYHMMISHNCLEEGLQRQNYLYPLSKRMGCGDLGQHLFTYLKCCFSMGSWVFRISWKEHSNPSLTLLFVLKWFEWLCWLSWFCFWVWLGVRLLLETREVIHPSSCAQYSLLLLKLP